MLKCAYINGSPQNTFVPGCVELAEKKHVFIGGDDFKSGQTKFKSVVVDFLVNAGIKPKAIVSYNHLGNNDGKNLSEPHQFKAKEVSKSNVVDDMVAANGILFADGEKPDHTVSVKFRVEFSFSVTGPLIIEQVVIKYVPHVGDSKRAMDEYSSEILMGGQNTIAVHNTCEDSLLATPIILDLVILTELCQRISFKVEGQDKFQGFHSVLSILAYMCKVIETYGGHKNDSQTPSLSFVLAGPAGAARRAGRQCPLPTKGLHREHLASLSRIATTQPHGSRAQAQHSRGLAEIALERQSHGADERRHQQRTGRTRQRPRRQQWPHLDRGRAINDLGTCL